MKRVFLLLIGLAFVVSAYSQANLPKSQNPQGSDCLEENSCQCEQQSIIAPAVYYVVIGSYSSLENAIKARNDLMYISPEWLSPPPIFTDVVKALLSTKNCGRLINKIFKQTRFT